MALGHRRAARIWRAAAAIAHLLYELTLRHELGLEPNALADLLTRPA